MSAHLCQLHFFVNNTIICATIFNFSICYTLTTWKESCENYADSQKSQQLCSRYPNTVTHCDNVSANLFQLSKIKHLFLYSCDLAHCRCTIFGGGTYINDYLEDLQRGRTILPGNNALNKYLVTIPPQYFDGICANHRLLAT